LKEASGGVAVEGESDGWGGGEVGEKEKQKELTGVTRGKVL